MKVKKNERALLGEHKGLEAYILIHDHGKDLLFRRKVDDEEKFPSFFGEDDFDFIARMAMHAKEVTEDM